PQVVYPGGVPEHGGSGRVVLVIDRSLSMGLQEAGETLLSRARDGATDVIDGLPSGALASVVVFGDEAMALTEELTTDHERLRAAVVAIQPTNETSNLQAGLHEARRLLAGEPGEVLLFSDEAGPRTVPDARTELEALIELGSTVLPMPVHADPPRNVAVTRAQYVPGVDGGTLTLRLANYGPDGLEVACEVTLPDGQSIPIFVDLPPAGEAEERVTIPSKALGGVGAAVCTDPDLPADDARYFHLPRVGASRVLVVDGDPGDTPTRSEVYFLERALAPWGAAGSARGGLLPDVIASAGVADLDPDVHRVVFLANVADPRPFGPLLTEFVRKGGNVVLAAGDNITDDRYNAALGAILPAPFRQARSLTDAEEPGIPLVLPPTTDHPLFKPFSRSGRAAFAKVRSHRVLTLDAYEDRPDEVTTLLAYEGGIPALVERRIGQGRVLVWTSTVDWGWSNLPLQSAFMPLVQGIVRYLGGESGSGAARFDGTVGEPVRIPLPDLAVEPDITGPDGQPVRSRIEGSTLIFRPDAAGAYAVGLPDAPPLAFVAVNTDPLESDVRRTDSVVGIERELDPERFVVREDLASASFGLAFVLLVLQALVAARTRGETP
ncbi:MAG: VWA domain-containing protein, partial [Myxococcales bacterium]|nr:VWA domain-containing protein [Myxococcales bacterium]